MTRQRYVFQDRKFIPESQAKKSAPVVHSVINDEMPALKHPGTGEYFTSKAKFKQRTRELGLEECYGEPDKYWEEDKGDVDAEIEDDVLKSHEQLRYGEGLSEEEREQCQIMDRIAEWKAENE